MALKEIHGTQNDILAKAGIIFADRLAQVVKGMRARARA